MKRILVVDDDKENVELLAEYLTREGHSVQSAGDAETASHRLKAWKPHLVVLDVNLPGSTGLELIPRIRAVTADDYVPVIVSSADISLEAITNGMEAGADDYLAKPYRAQDLIARVRINLRFKEVQDSLRRANHRIDELSSHDDLTGLYNMRALYKRGEDEIARSKRFRKPLSALMLNLDGFARINQAHGFVFGTHVLQEAAKRIKECVRSIDLVARLGADEYFVLLLETDLAGAEYTAERMRDAIQSLPFKSERQSFDVTACIGISSLTSQPQFNMADLLNDAFEALRSSKAGGTNSIEVHSVV